MNKNQILLGTFGGIILLGDQLTKWIILKSSSEIPITFFLSFEKTYNRGVSWGLFSSASPWIFLYVSLLVAFLTLTLALSAYHRVQNKLSIYPEIAIIAGSCSNLIDRVVHGGVVDFILVHYHDLAWPVFNAADIAIVFGVLSLFIRQLRTA